MRRKSRWGVRRRAEKRGEREGKGIGKTAKKRWEGDKEEGGKEKRGITKMRRIRRAKKRKRRKVKEGISMRAKKWWKEGERQWREGNKGKEENKEKRAKQQVYKKKCKPAWTIRRAEKRGK